MCRVRPVELDATRGPGPGQLNGPPLSGIPFHFRRTMEDRRRFLRGKGLRVTLTCLVAALGAFVLLEAFDADVALWPIGAEDCTAAGDALTSAAVLPLQESASLNPFPGFGLTAGTRLVAHHRARSALATDRSLFFHSLNVAEPWRQDLKDAPVLGHCVCMGPGDDRQGAGWARRAQPGSLVGALSLARQFVS